MSYAISRSTRDRKLFVLVSGNKESEMEFPFKEGVKHRANASRFTHWVDRNVTSKSKRNKKALADAVAKSQYEHYLQCNDSTHG